MKIFFSPGPDRHVEYAAGFVDQMFRHQLAPRVSHKPLFSHFTTATDTTNIQVVFSAVMDNVIHENIRKVKLAWLRRQQISKQNFISPWLYNQGQFYSVKLAGWHDQGHTYNVELALWRNQGHSHNNELAGWRHQIHLHRIDSALNT